MKRVIALILLVALLPTVVFSVPLVPNDDEFTFSFDENQLPIELTEAESEEVEGEGVISAAIGAIGGAVTGAAVAILFPAP